MKTLAFLGLILASAVGCSSSDKTDEPVVDTGVAAEETGATDTGADETAPADTAPATLTPPVLDQLMKMAGALHVMWTNKQTCDSVLIERKDDATDWKQIFSVKGTFDNKMDNGATADTNYTYRLRCKVGEAMSAYSNELTKNPTK